MTRLGDLHIHSVYSDGSDSPEQIAKLARAAGLDFIAITDHDRIGDHDEKLAAAKQYGLSYVKGIEISSYFNNNQVHILGYGFDEKDTVFNGELDALFKARIERTKIMLDKLKKHFDIDLDLSEVTDDKTDAVGSMQIARQLVKKGYAQSISGAFDSFLGLGQKAFSGFGRKSPYKAIEMINAAGGVAVLAHPQKIKLNDSDRENLIISLTKCGLFGIEAVYLSHTISQTNYYKNLAKKLNLLVTGGSDYHGEGRSERIGDIKIALDENQLKTLKII